jgi:ribonuclease R
MEVQIDAVSAALRDAHGHGLTLKQLAGQLHLGQAARQPLRRALQQLLGEGQATFDGHRYRFRPTAGRKDGNGQAQRGGRRDNGHDAGARTPASRKSQAASSTTGRQPTAAGRSLTGILHLKPEGYGFVSPLQGGSGRQDDVFVPPRRNRGALDGDVVRVQVERGRDGRFVGEVVEVVERRRQFVIGLYRAEAKATWVEPHDRAFTDPIPVARDPRAKDGELVKVRLRREDGGPLRGDIVGVLGKPGDPRVEILATAYAEGFSDEFDPATLLAAQGIPDHVRPEDIAGRRDLRELPLVTIDGEDARDFDDAVHVSRVGDGGYRLVVAIADVAHYVKPGGALDREALRRGTSVYFPSMVLPMLPERISNGICSLNPDVDRLCMVCDLALDSAGRPLHAEIYEGVMRSHARLTYTKVADALGGEPEADLRPLLDDLRVGHELSKKLTAQRRERGSIDFDLPEAKIVLADDGTVKEIVRRPRNDAHRLVEEFMLAANEAVARFFDARGLPTVYRIHDEPDEEKLDAFAQLARLHGFEIPSELSPAALNELLEKLQGKPQQKALNSLLLRAMMQAQYSPDNIGHFGLAAPTYLHFTSPIRRYPDLMVHRLLKEHWARAGRPMRDSERKEQEEYLAGIAAQCSERERASMKAERDIDAFFAALFMIDKVGEEYEAIVAGVTDFGLFCELKDVYVEGLITKEKLGEGVELDEEHHRLRVGKSGRSYGVGDELRVRVVEADPVRRRIALEPASLPRSGSWLTEDDVAASARSPKQKPRRPGPPGQRPGSRRPPRGSPPGRRSRRTRTRASGR